MSFVVVIFSLFCFALSSELAAQQAATVRAVTYGQVGGVNGDCYVVSAQYQTKPASGSGDVFAAAMGKNIAGLGYPWTALGYVHGDYDLDYYNNTLDQVNVDASGAVVAWAFVALGEFCDNNGQEGFQNNTSDFIIKYFDAPLGAPYTQNCGVRNDPTTQEQSYYSSIESNLGVFNTSCIVLPKDSAQIKNGRKIGRYQFKCDVRIDYSLLWDTNPITINGCPDSKRKVGLLVNIAAGAFDVDVSIDSRFNTRSSFVADSDYISLAAGKLEFAWDNYFIKTPDRVATTGTSGRVTYGYLKTDAGSYRGATTVQRVIFSFSTPKSENKNYFYWDPTINVNAAPASLVSLFGIVVTILSVVFLF
jgi:hypothetical protein